MSRGSGTTPEYAMHCESDSVQERDVGDFFVGAFLLSPVASLDAQGVDSRPSLSVPC